MNAGDFQYGGWSEAHGSLHAPANRRVMRELRPYRSQASAFDVRCAPSGSCLTLAGYGLARIASDCPAQ
jgi:hypothetical protein